MSFLPGMAGVAGMRGGQQGEQNLYAILSGLGLTTNLQTCLDAGSELSYPGTGQSWLDLTPNGQSFFLGADGSATSTDPTFNGTAGALSSAEFFSVDGGDYFTYDSSNETWMDNLHKDNAVYSIVSWNYFATSTTEQMFWGDSNGAGVGVSLRLNVANTLRFRVNNASGAALDATSTLAVSDAAWTMVAVTLNEATGAAGGRFYKNSGTKATETFTSTYTTPSASAASATLKLLARGDAAGMPESGARVAMVAMWGGTQLSDANLDAIYDATKGRFGL